MLHLVNNEYIQHHRDKDPDRYPIEIKVTGELKR
jgi:hypothetical protein